MVLRGLYTILLGIFLALFVGIGINAFYPEQIYKAPASCMIPMQAPIEKNSINEQDQCQKDQQQIDEQRNFYTQIVSSIALIFALIYFVISFVILRNQEIFSYGFLFGCISSLLYSVIRGLSSNHAWFAFIIVVISLVLVMAIGYMRFVREEDSFMNNKKKK